MSDCRRAVSFGMRLMIIESTYKSLSCCTSIKNGVCMIRSAAEHTTPDGRARKAFIFVCHRCLHFRLQTGGSCFAVKLASLLRRVGGIGYQSINNATNYTAPTNILFGRATLLTRLVQCSCPYYDLLSALSEADGAARTHEMRVNSRPALIMTLSHHAMYAVMTEPSSVVPQSRMLITF